MATPPKIALPVHFTRDEPLAVYIAEHMAQYSDIEMIFSEHHNDWPTPEYRLENITMAFLDDFYGKKVGPFLTQTMCNLDNKGYGAIITGSFADPGVIEAQRRCKTPILGPGYANFMTASRRFGTFSMLHPHMVDAIPYFENLLEAYGLRRNCRSIEHFPVDIYTHIQNKTTPDLVEYTNIAIPIIERAVKKGAKSIVIGCGAPIWSSFAPRMSEISEREFGVPVFPPFETLLQCARECCECNWRTDPTRIHRNGGR